MGIKEDVLNEIMREYNDATSKHGKFHNAHEAYAVLLEEVDELWQNVKLNHNDPERKVLMYDEAKQVAAMAIRFIVDCCIDNPQKDANVSGRRTHGDPRYG